MPKGLLLRECRDRFEENSFPQLPVLYEEYSIHKDTKFEPKETYLYKNGKITALDKDSETYKELSEDGKGSFARCARIKVDPESWTASFSFIMAPLFGRGWESTIEGEGEHIALGKAFKT